MKHYYFKAKCEINGEILIPLHLSAPQDVLFVIHVNREVLIFALLYGIRPSGDGPHFIELKNENKYELFFRFVKKY